MSSRKLPLFLFASELNSEPSPLFRIMDGTAGNADAKYHWFPIYYVAAIGLALRLFVAWGPPHIGYPDEVFQYLEQAHRLVFGYGIVPWEYRFGVRNWLLPGALAAPLAAMKYFGLDRPDIYIPAIKTIVATLSISVIFASFTIGKNLFGAQTAKLAAIFAAIWYELVLQSPVATPEVLGGYALFCAFALLLNVPTWTRAAGIGCIIGLSVALRVQYALPAAAIAALIFFGWPHRYTIIFVISATAVIAFAGLLDVLTWGKPFISYWNAIIFNVYYGIADYFGRRTFFYYPGVLTMHSAGLFTLAGVYGFLAWKRCWPLLLIAGCIVIPHSFVAHKEYRFIFAVVPILIVLLADAVAFGLSRILNSRWAQPTAVGLVLVFSLWKIAPNNNIADDRLAASLYLSKQPEVSAIIDLSDQWTSSGGFYFLHRDVPYYFQQQVANESADTYRQIASHIILTADQASPPGFKLERRVGGILIFAQETPPASYRLLKDNGHAPRFPPVEDRFKPSPK